MEDTEEGGVCHPHRLVTEHLGLSSPLARDLLLPSSEALSSDLCSSLDIGPSYRMPCWKQDLISVGLSNPFLVSRSHHLAKTFLEWG